MVLEKRKKFHAYSGTNGSLFRLRLSDGWRVVDDDYGQAVGKLQAESMMSIPASLFPQ
jgi:hypothetical protein